MIGSDHPARVAAGLRLVVTVAALAGGQVVLWWAGRVLPSLPLDAAGVERSFGEADPLALAVSLLRLLALVVGSGLLLATLLGVAARGCGAARLVVRLDRWTPSGLRRLLDGALGVGLAASIGFSALPAGADGGDARATASATIRRLPDAATTSTLRRLPDAPMEAEPGGPPSSPAASSPAPAGALRHLPAARSLPPAPPGPAPPATSGPPATEAAPPSTPTPARAPEVVVQPGDSFWRLAESHQAERLGRLPTEAETGACWHTLIAMNRDRLAVPGDPDLIFPGQVLLLPLGR